MPWIRCIILVNIRYRIPWGHGRTGHDCEKKNGQILAALWSVPNRRCTAGLAGHSAGVLWLQPASGDQFLGDLERVQGCAFPQVVGYDPED